jgi:predicted esterase
LVVGFHGYGASASSFGKTAQVLAEMGFVVALPESAYPLLANGKLGFQWFPSTKDDEDSQRAAHLLFSENTPAILDDLKARYAIDKVYALGFSEGAVAALGTAIFNHEDFAGSVQFGLPLFSADWITAQELSAGKSVRLLFVHGREDDRAPLAVSEEARSYFRDADYESALEVFDGGHTVPQDQLKVAAEWMSREERGTPDVR